MRHRLAIATVAALLVSSGSAVGAQEASPDPGASPTPEQLAVAEERLASATCLGKPATIVAIPGFETIGTDGADVIVGTEGDDIIRGVGGNDRICAGAGSDLVEGGDGKDRIDGGVSDDTLDGGAANDIISGGKGADMVTGGAGNDRLTGGRGDDTLDGGKGKDVCNGGPGNDWLPGCNDRMGTRGTLNITRNTKLKGPHRGSIVMYDANGVTLDCGGNAVTGRGGGMGIHILDTNGATIKNCDVSNFTQGIVLGGIDGSHRNTLTRNRVHGNSGSGIVLHHSNRNRIISNTSNESGSGFEIEMSHRNVLKRNSASGNADVNYSLKHGSLGNRLSQNVASGAETGFMSTDDKSVFTGNTATGSDYGFVMEGGANELTRNIADDNAVGFSDGALPGANTYTDNVCTNNRQEGSSPEGLCAETMPAEPEVTDGPGEGAAPDATAHPTE